MQKLLLTFLFFFSSLFALEFKVASYNVENLFDLKYDKTEYKEYIPHQRSNWNHKAYTKKLNNTARVIKDINANIIALQEIESQEVIIKLKQKLPQYPYHAFSKNKNSSVGLAILSQYPITQTQSIVFKTKVNRPIQKVDIDIKGHKLTIFNNHWASKRNKESHRVNFAMHLQEAIKHLDKNNDYILLGDFNSNYNENKTLIYQKRLNDTNGFTGINHVLNTFVYERIINKTNINEQEVPSHYNLWYELPVQERFSAKFRGTPNSPDNMLLSKALFDDENISYINNSFKVFKTDYLYDKGKINRWKLSKTKVHQQKGYSDHLPIVAKFTVKPYIKEAIKKPSSIKDLYQIEQLQTSVKLEEVSVIYKNGSDAIIKRANDKAIYLYNCAQELKEGFTYTLSITKLKTFQGLKEVIQIDDIVQHAYNNDYKKLFTTAKNINLQDAKFQNEIITQLEGSYNKGYLHYGNNQKIRLYAKDKKLLPNHRENITIISGHLGYFKNQAQIIIHKKSDIKVNF